ncbi:5'-nucleotidase, partial [Thamnocephalis sphaerospora]
SVPEHPATKVKVLKWRETLDAFGKVVVGELTAPFDQSQCQRMECEMGNLVADAMLYARRNRPEVRAAIINAGGVRAGLDVGTVRVENVNIVLPFLNALLDFDLTGKQLIYMLETVLAKTNRENGRPITSFVQVSGLKIAFDMLRPEYDRVTEVWVRKAGPITIQSPAADEFELLVPDTVYTFVTADFILDGGDGFFATPPAHSEPLDMMADVLANYIRAATPVSPKRDNRLQSANGPISSMARHEICHLYSDCE